MAAACRLRARHRPRHEPRRRSRVALTPFAQVDASRSRWREGTGLGLPIAKALVQLHGGRLEIRSAKSSGTEVTVTLPSRFARRGHAWPQRRRRCATAAARLDGHEELAQHDRPCHSRTRRRRAADPSIGRIVSVTGAKAIVLLDGGAAAVGQREPRSARSGPRWAPCSPSRRPTPSCLPSSRRSACRYRRSARARASCGSPSSAWSASCGKPATAGPPPSTAASRSIRRSATACALPRAQELEQAFCGDKRNSVRVGCIRQDPIDLGHHPRRRAARQALRHPRHHRHRQVVHDGADPALDPAEEPGRAHRAARPAQRVCAARSATGPR